jgi:hypothetical protein
MQDCKIDDNIEQFLRSRSENHVNTPDYHIYLVCSFIVRFVNYFKLIKKKNAHFRIK